MKKCTKCSLEKDLNDFYKCKKMKDGHFNKCKNCYKKDVLSHRSKNIEKIRAYDRERGCRHRNGYLKEWREKFPNKYKAHTMINNAVRDGKLFPLPCEVCFKTHDLHAHHDDYAKPLNVRWLCAAHHKQWHRDNGEALNP